MSKQTWEFLRRGAMSVSADAMANPLRNTELSQAELLMREAIQNSGDEKVEGSNDPVRFVVTRSELRGEDKARVVELLQLPVIQERSNIFGNKAHGWFDGAQNTLKTLDDPDVPFTILGVSDYNTKGLGGKWNEEGDIENRFHNLVLSLLSSEKLNEEDPNLLGSYGVGKMVFALTSRLRTMAYYSVFKPTKATDGKYARFMATGFFPRHKTKDGNSWTGHAFLGEKNDNEHYPIRPIVDEVAHKFVEEMGFDSRASDETGTSVFLFDCPLTVKECREACEKYWWPRLLDPKSQDYIDLEFKDQDRKVSGVQPNGNQSIQPFIQCYRVLQENQTGLPGYEIEKRIPKTGDVGGKLSLKAVNAKATDTNLVNSVALIRGGLVIRYEKKYAREGSPEMAGVFSVAESNLKAFTLSEPEAHDNWLETQDRLKQVMSDKGQGLIKRTHKAIENCVRDFQIRLEDRKKEKLADDADFLDRILGPIFDKKRKPRTPPDPPDPSERAISIHKSSRSEERNGQLFQILDVSVALSDVANVDITPATIAIDFKPLISADGSKGPSVPRRIYSSNGDLVANQDQKKIEISIEKKHRTDFRAEAIAHPSWRANWIVTVTGNPKTR